MRDIVVELPELELPGLLEVPDDARSVVVFVHGSGSSRHSPRNQRVAEALSRAGHATLLFDLLSEREAADRELVFDIGLLAERTAGAVAWVSGRREVTDLPVGLFGASTGAAAALDAAVRAPERVAAVVSRGGRPDLATGLDRVAAPVLLIVGGDDPHVLELNRQAATALSHARIEVVPGAGHLFEGPGELEVVTQLALDWFDGVSLPH